MKGFSTALNITDSLDRKFMVCVGMSKHMAHTNQSMLSGMFNGTLTVEVVSMQ